MFEGIMEGLNDALAISRGEIKPACVYPPGARVTAAEIAVFKGALADPRRYSAEECANALSPRYIAIVDGKKGAYGVTFPDLPGCTAMGKTKAQALRNARGAVSEWLDSTIDHGEPIPRRRTIEELQADRKVQEDLAACSGQFAQLPW
jgi:predicted RNase H-like HicB family nuclease